MKPYALRSVKQQINSTFLKFFICSLFLGPSINLYAQSSGEITLILHQEKMLSTRGLGRLLGKPIDASRFKFDSSGYSKFYVCEGSLSTRTDKVDIKIHYLIGQKTKDELLVTIDKNFNDNFLDDPVKKIKLSDCNNCDFAIIADTIILNLQKFTGKPSDSYSLHIVPPCCMKNFTRHSNYPFIDTLNIGLESPFENAGIISESGKNFRVSIWNSFPRINYSDKNNVGINIMDTRSQVIHTYGLADTLRIGTKFYTINHLSPKADTVMLKRVPGKVLQGYAVGFYPYDIREKDISSNNIISLADFKGKYVLMEFWGTWCGPCVGLHDDIVKLLDTHNQIKYVGVAWDTDINKVKNYISTSPAIRRQIFVDMKSKQPGMINLFRVSNYPTFILIGKNEQIIFRDYGTPGFDKLLEFLKSM